MTFVLDHIQGPDGVRLRYGVNTPRPGCPHILILQGRGEYIERYQETADDLATRGFGCVSLDFRGQGGSQRETSDPAMGYVGDLARYEADTRLVIDHLSQTRGITCRLLLTHSTGGLVGMKMMLEQPGLWQSAIMAAPFFGLAGPRWFTLAARFLCRGMCRCGWAKHYLPGQRSLSPLLPFDPENILTSDPARHARNVAFLTRHPELIVGGASAGWLDACLRAQTSIAKRIRRNPASPELPPVTMVLAGDDRVVSNRVTTEIFGAHPNVIITEIPGARHEILQEHDRFRNRFWSAFEAHLARHHQDRPDNTVTTPSDG